MIGLRLVAGLVLAGCAPPERDVAWFTRHPDEARAHIARCDARQVARGCEAARRALAEAGRRRRMAAYRATFEAEP